MYKDSWTAKYIRNYGVNPETPRTNKNIALSEFQWFDPTAWFDSVNAKAQKRLQNIVCVHTVNKYRLIKKLNENLKQPVSSIKVCSHNLYFSDPIHFWRMF